MTYKVNTIVELKDVVWSRWNDLDNINSRYVSAAGKAAKEAYRSVIWYLGFYEDVTEIEEDSEFMDLVNIPGKHYEYYKILREIYRVIERMKNDRRNCS